MDLGVKHVPPSLTKLTQELEYFLNVTNHQLRLLKETVYIAKDIVNLPIRKSASTNEENESFHSSEHQNDSKGQILSEELSLENEIRKVLQVAEKVRNSSHKNQSAKGHLVVEKIKSVDNIKEKDLPVLRTKSMENITSEKGAISKSTRKTIGNSCMKTTYQKDFYLKKEKTFKKSLEGKEMTSESSIKNNLQASNPKKQGFRNTKGSKSSSAQDLSSVDKNKLASFVQDNSTLTRKKEYSSNSLAISLPFDPAVSMESFLSGEILIKSQNPQFRDVLRLLKEGFTHMSEAKREVQNDEGKLKDTFMKRYSISEKATQNGNHQDVDSIYRNLLPCCRIWKDGIESLSDSDLNKVKDITIKAELKLKNILDRNQEMGFQKPFGRRNFVPSESNTKDSKRLRRRNYSELWAHPFISPILREMDELPFLYYNHVQEWLSFENSLLESQECYIQQKILDFLHTIMEECFFSRENNFAVDEKRDPIPLLLKTLATTADFSGSLTVPLLAYLTGKETTR